MKLFTFQSIHLSSSLIYLQKHKNLNTSLNSEIQLEMQGKLWEGCAICQELQRTQILTFHSESLCVTKSSAHIVLKEVQHHIKTSEHKKYKFNGIKVRDCHHLFELVPVFPRANSFTVIFFSHYRFWHQGKIFGF